MPLPAFRFPPLRSPALRRFVGRFVALGRRAVDLFPLTPLGLVTAGAAALALFRYGVARVDLLYLVIGAVGLGLGALGLLLTVLTAIALRIGLARGPRGAAPAPLRLECGVRTATGFSLPSLWYLPIVRAHWSWTRPRGSVHTTREHGRLMEQVIPERRGLEEIIERRIEVSDAFALTRVAFLHREVRLVRAVPSTGALDRLQLSRSIAGGDDVYHPEGPAEGERVDLRGYAPGDPIRFILWKVFAKTRELVVRTPERALSPARRALAYVVTGRGDEAAAGVARRAVETGALGASFVLGADGVAMDARTTEETLEVLARSASTTEGTAAGTTDGSGAGLQAFLQRASPAGAASGARAVVFVPAFDGPWRARLVASARGRGARAPVQIVVCADGIDRARPQSLAWRLVSAGQKVDGDERPKARDLEALIAALAATGAEVVLVDRTQGRLYAGAAMLSRPAREGAASSPSPTLAPTSPAGETATSTPSTAPAPLGAPILDGAAPDGSRPLPQAPESS